MGKSIADVLDAPILSSANQQKAKSGLYTGGLTTKDPLAKAFTDLASKTKAQYLRICKDYKIIAIDFDGTLCENAWPEIGKPIWKTISKAKKRRKKGDKLILWTCREGKELQEAIDWCAKWNLKFDAVNENLPESLSLYGGRESRKIGADEYWDDKAVVL
jgi:hypothetical protein